MITFTIDVESIGLHGDSYAVGWVVHEDGKEIDSGILAIDPQTVNGSDSDRQWVADNIPPLEVNCPGCDSMRCLFWAEWLEWKNKGAIMVSDCGWPVEARVLNWCVDWDDEARKWEGPYPLHDLATLALVKGVDPLATHDRLPDELPKHNPTCDARQSARIFWSLLK